MATILEYNEFKEEYDAARAQWVTDTPGIRDAIKDMVSNNSSLRDKYIYPVQNPALVFVLNGKKVEFKLENEKNPEGKPYLSYNEAVALEAELTDGWRLPTKAEMNSLLYDNYDKYEQDNKGRVFFSKNNRLFLPALGIIFEDGTSYDKDGDYGVYMTSDVNEDNIKEVWALVFDSQKGSMFSYPQECRMCVRMLREVK